MFFWKNGFSGCGIVMINHEIWGLDCLDLNRDQVGDASCQNFQEQLAAS